MKYSKITLGLVTAMLLASCGGSDDKKPPKANSIPTATATSFTTQADTKYTGTFTGTDADMDKLSFMVATAPTKGTLMLNADGTYSYTPNAEFTGSDKFSFQSYDGKNYSPSADVAITVNLLEVTFSEYSRKAFNQATNDKPLPLNSRNITQDVTAANAYDDLLTP